MIDLTYGKAICYSGFRTNQSPATNIYPTYKEVQEDLILLNENFDYIRMYAPSKHAEVALQVIRDNKLDLQVMLGIDLLGEISNYQCPWGGIYDNETIQANVNYNDQQLVDLIRLANEYEDIIFSVSAGNESVPEWNENLVSVERVLYFVKELKQRTTQLVTYCENFYYWGTLLQEVAEHVDFISLHTYPVWTGIEIDRALSSSLLDYYQVVERYPHKTVIITEAGWPTFTDDETIKLTSAKLENHEKYISLLNDWSEKNQTLVFYFEAFDEPWKGSSNMAEPEKHWGFYDVDRKLKLKGKKSLF